MKPFSQDEMRTLYQGDVREVLPELTEHSVDMIITSPPYYGLRKYDGEGVVWDGVEGCVHEWGNGKLILGNNRNFLNVGGRKSNNPAIIGSNDFCRLCGAWRGQLGLEPTPELYIKHLCDIFDLSKRVLKKTGTLWVNIDDSYAGSGKASGQSIDQVSAKQATNFASAHLTQDNIGVPAKSLIGIPERFVLEMGNRGWIRRNTIIWHKNNPMPESVKDRFTSDFEYLYLFSQQQDYYFEQQFEAYSPVTLPRMLRGTGNHKYVEHPEMNGGGAGNQPRENIRAEYENWQYDGEGIKDYESEGVQNPSDVKRRIIESIKKQSLGRNKRCVWTINTKPYKQAHFATFPPELIRTPILAGCPQFICSKCGEPREKMYDHKNMVIDRSDHAKKSGIRIMSLGNMVSPAENTFIGYSDCGCGAEFKSGVVMDIFSGSGTVCQVATELRRRSIGIDQSMKYNKMAIKRNAQIRYEV